jgi:arginyl-tRNA synthetase
MDEMIQTAQKISNELGKLDGLSHEQAEDTVRKIGLGALKYFILKVDPKKNMVFDPAESIDFNGNTGPFIQYTYARIQSVLRKATDELNIDYQAINYLDAVPSEQEMNLIQAVSYFKNVVNEAAENFSPACVANYVYELTKDYNRFYHDHSILGKDVDHNVKLLRLAISNNVAKIIHAALALLGIDTPDRM